MLRWDLLLMLLLEVHPCSRNSSPTALQAWKLFVELDSDGIATLICYPCLSEAKRHSMIMSPQEESQQTLGDNRTPSLLPLITILSFFMPKVSKLCICKVYAFLLVTVLRFYMTQQFLSTQSQFHYVWKCVLPTSITKMSLKTVSYGLANIL